jgi:hypothetical protein
MSVKLIFIAVLIGIILWMDIKATSLVIRDSLSDPAQRAIQLSMVWLIPVIGALIVLAVHRPPEKQHGTYREPPDPGDDFGLPMHSARGRSENGGDDD